MCRSPRESVEIEVDSDVISVSILSEVAKIDGSVRYVRPNGLLLSIAWERSVLLGVRG